MATILPNLKFFKFIANRLFSNINVSQGNVATYARSGGIFAPGNERSLCGRFVPGNESAWERNVHNQRLVVLLFSISRSLYTSHK